MDLMGAFSNKLQNSLNDLTRKKNITEADVKETIKEIRLILLEADVNYSVAKTFCNTIREKALNEEILNGLDPQEQIIKIVRDEMIELLAGENQLSFESNNIMMMVGLQGSGKTTSTGKIANFLRKKKRFKKPLLVACDIYRPAAIDQLVTLGKQLAIDVYLERDNRDVVEIAGNAIAHAKEHGHDLIILDTAGRMHVDTELMDELKRLEDTFKPAETLLVLDGTVGQMAIEVADNFSQYVNISGLIFTKMDGDTRGGGVLSVKQTTGKDIKFLGVSEKLDGLEEFNPERVVSRILGMGDVLGLIEKAEELDTQENIEMAERMLEGNFDLNDFLKQINMISKMGGLRSIMSMIPGVNKSAMAGLDEREIDKVKAIILSMTPTERTKPSILNAKRRLRIAKGSGTEVSDINRMMKGYDQMKKMMKTMGKMDMDNMDMNKLKNMNGMNNLFK
ncbi:signal recognition particle protein [Mollicutes bacterium LVI A0039]|nr:signal recognition particle protein [Mollicutes bacterium LVI A0039]